MMKTKLNRTIMGLTFLGVASLGLSGCVVNVGEGESHWKNRESWEKVQHKNRNNLTQLSLGMTKDQVMIIMGNADFSEAYIQNGDVNKEVIVLFYRTQHTHSDGKTTKDECTPIVISNNALVGWGETAYSKI